MGSEADLRATTFLEYVLAEDGMKTEGWLELNIIIGQFDMGA